MIPKRLQIGDTIGIVSPSGAITKETMNQFKRGIDFLKNIGFNVKIGKNALSNTLKYSATPQEKADDLNYMFADNKIKAIICSQGGDNANSILPLIDFNAIKNNPKIFLGISDITVLLNAIYKETGVVTFHGNDIMWGFGAKHTDYDEEEFKDRLVESKIGEVNHNSRWKCIRDGVAEGILIGGNLNCLNKLAGTRYLPNFKAKILLLESFDESNPPEKVEAELYRLKQMGVFEKIKGMWMGYYNHESKILYEEIVMNVVPEYSFPILKCDDFGHNTPNTIIPIGVKIRLDSTNRKVVLLEKCVA
ncbi:LD-carboxypeptidase [Candidatus Woesearchaeota archaeon]|nr:LD-carboxypeptidase [Candidatus Woesearchaeota archaeon]